MKKRIFSYMIALVMVCSIICVGVPAEAAAASKPYMSVSADLMAQNGVPRDKVGKYYIWVNSGYKSSSLVRASSPKGKQTIIKKKKFLDSKSIVTNGNTIYYAIQDSNKYTIYKTDITGKTNKKVCSVSTKWGGILTGYYNGKLNFSIIEAEDLGQSTSIWEADVSKCSAKKLKLGPYGYSGYNQYILCRDGNLYNMKTKKFKKLSALKDINEGIVYKTNIYYTNVDWERYITTIKKCDLSGKNVKTIKKGKLRVIHLGKKAAYYTIGDSEKVHKVAYK